MTKPDIAEARRLADEMESNRVACRASPVLRALADELEDARADISELKGQARSAISQAVAAQAERDTLRRGEFICRKCGLRKDADAAGPVPF